MSTNYHQTTFPSSYWIEKLHLKKKQILNFDPQVVISPTISMMYHRNMITLALCIHCALNNESFFYSVKYCSDFKFSNAKFFTCQDGNTWLKNDMLNLNYYLFTTYISWKNRNFTCINYATIHTYRIFFMLITWMNLFPLLQ